jgi:peptidyl-prolyl cis-trans isomerase C
MAKHNQSVHIRVVQAGIVALCLIVTGCTRDTETSPKPIEVEGAAAAIVNGDKIFVSDVELEAVARGLVAAGNEFDPENPEYRTVLDQLIDQKLMAQEAEARNLDADPAARRRLNIARERILGNLLVESLVASEVTEANIDEMYSEQVKLQQSNDEVSIAHILVGTEKEADDLHARIIAGESFESLVFNNSKDTATRMENGDMGYVSPNDQTEPFPDMIAQTPLGEVSKPFETSAGWHILKVKDRRTRQPRTREEMRPEIVTFLTLNEISSILRKLRTEATIQQGVPGTQLDAPVSPQPSVAGEIGPATPVDEAEPSVLGDEL